MNSTLINAPTSNHVNRFKKGIGAYLLDEEGNKFIDFKNGFGSVILGYNDSTVNSKIKSLIDNNEYSLQSLTRYHDELKSALLSDFPYYDGVCLYNSGTSAVRAAVTAARKFSNKSIVLSAGYHGWDPMWELPETPFMPNNNGVVDYFFILEELQKLIKKYYDQIACLVISPDLSYFTNEYFVETLKIASTNNIMVIFDEVKTGYRYKPGSCIKYNGVYPDIVVLSKGLANGAKLSALVGQSHVLREISDMTITSFFDVLSVVSGVETIKKVHSNDVYESIRKMGGAFIEGTRKIICKYKLPVKIIGNGNLFQFVFASKEMSSEFYKLAKENGLHMYEEDNQCLSYAFDDGALELSLQRINCTLAKLSDKEEYLQMSIDDWQMCRTAYGQIDGVMNDLPVEKKYDFVSKVLFNEN